MVQRACERALGDLRAHATRLRADDLNPAFSRDALLPTEAAALLAENLTHPGHEFWTESLQIPAAIRGLEARLGYRQLTDTYQLALANRRKGVLATFDRGLSTLADDVFDSALEVVPPR